MSEEVKPYICYGNIFCDERFDTAEEREEHMRIAHPRPERKVVFEKIGKIHFSRIPDDAESTETDEDRNKEGPYPLPLEMIAMRCDSKGKSLRSKIRDEVWEFWPDARWKRVTEYYIDFNKRLKERGWIRLYLVTKIAIRLAKKIFEQTGIEVFPIVDRVSGSRADKSAGSWSWSMKGTHRSPESPLSTASMFEVGSQWPMNFLLLKGVKLESSYMYQSYLIDPDPEGMKLYKSRFDRR